MILHQSIRKEKPSRLHRVRESFKIITCILLASLSLNLLLTTSLFTPKSRRLLTLKDGAGESCPFNLGQFIPPVVNRKTADAAASFARQIDAESVVRLALEREALHRKTILVGDSLTRQIFASLGCMLYREGVLDEYYTAWQSDMDEGDPLRHFNDARIRYWWKGKHNQIFFHPTAGMINEYGWGFERQSSPLKGTEHWLESCEKREPFFLNTYKVRNNGRLRMLQTFFNTKDPLFEKLPLGINDVVIFNAGIHPSTRTKNLKKIAQLADCMREARSRNEAPIWPTIRYMRSSQQHFTSDAGTWTLESGNSRCLTIDETKNMTDPYYLEDMQYLEGKLPILGGNVGLKHLPHLHAGVMPGGKKVDCSHWAMPGVPNLFVKVIMRSLINL